MGYINYDRVRYAYETPIPRYQRDGLAKAAAEAAVRASRWHPEREDLGYAYRVIDATYSTCIDPDGDVYGSSTQLEIIAFPIVKKTDSGFRIWRGGSKELPETRWVSFAWNKSWASLTPEGAVKDYIARKKRQASIYEARANTARVMQREAERLLGGEA